MSEEEMLHCPYVQAHVVLKSRMARHLIKCRQQFPLENFTTCPFNATHDVPTPELKYHVDTCPDRKTMENYLYIVDNDEDKKEEELKSTDVQVPKLEENWDEEMIPGSYLEVKNKVLEEHVFFRQPVGKSKTEKKVFLRTQVEKFSTADQEKSITEKPKNSPFESLKRIVSDEPDSDPPEPRPGVAKGKNEEEEFKFSVRKKTGVGRGISMRETH